MQKTILTTLLIIALTTIGKSQFHTLKIPKQSSQVMEIQRLGVTDITMNYSSPKVNGRKVFETVVPKNGDPIPWRAGANMNTTITFTTDVLIEGKELKAGTYGFHTIPSDGKWTLLFAHASEQWGSYYLDREKDISLEVNVTPSENSFTELLEYTFKNRTDSTLQIAIEWENLRIPFTIEVNLNETVINSLRSELRGINTYHWQAWNDAAQWCYDRNTNLEEALVWVNRSIEGGYGGFASDKNAVNLSLKSNILYNIGKETEAIAALDEAVSVTANPNQLYELGMAQLRMEHTSKAIEIFKKGEKQYPDAWFIYLGQSRCYSRTNDFKQATKAIDKAIVLAPEKYPQDFRPYLNSLKLKLVDKETI